MLDIPSISAIVAATGVILGVALAYLEVRSLVKNGQTDLVWRLYSDINEKEFHDAWIKVVTLEITEYSNLVKEYGQIFSGKPIPDAILKVGNFFEGVGVLLHRKLIDIGIVSDLLPAEMTWEKMKHIVEGMRKQFGDPRFYEWFEYLYNEMKKREQQLARAQ